MNGFGDQNNFSGCTKKHYTLFNRLVWYEKDITADNESNVQIWYFRLVDVVQIGTDVDKCKS